jgi:hypothetical protein
MRRTLMGSPRGPADSGTLLAFGAGADAQLERSTTLKIVE